MLKVMGNEIVCGVCDGTAPLGVLDDVVVNAFTAPVIDEVVVIPAVGVNDGYGHYIAATSVMKMLAYSNIVRSSFIADTEGLILYDMNGVLEAPVGTLLNYDSDGDGMVDSIRAIVSYVYRIGNIPGDNTTIGSGRVSIWVSKMLIETDQYDTKARYVVNAPLFCNSEGLFTTEQESASNPGIAMVTGPPTGMCNTLEILWF
jgi:hypothetical protein